MNFNLLFFDELEEKLPDSFLTYWSMRTNYGIVEDGTTYRQYMEDVVTEYFGPVPQERLADQVSKLKLNHRKKKHDWKKKFENGLEYPFNDPYNPLCGIHAYLTSLSLYKFAAKYEAQTIDEVLEDEKEELKKSVEEWNLSKPVLFTMFPAMSIIPSKAASTALKEDILTYACQYIMNDLQGDLSNIAKSLPSPIASKPFFATSSSRVTLDEIDGLWQKIILTENNGDTFSVIAVDEDSNVLSNLDSKDHAVYQEIIKSAISDKRTDDGLAVTKINLYAIAQNIHGYRPSSQLMEQVRRSIIKMSKRRFRSETPTGKIDYILIDSIIGDINDKNTTDYVIKLGSVPTHAILQKDLISLSRKDIAKITSPYGNIFAYAMQQTRFKLFRDNPENMTINLSLEYFERHTWFTTKIYKKKVSIVVDVLDDYKAHDIIINDFKYENNIFKINFKPISEEEIDYYKQWAENNPKGL